VVDAFLEMIPIAVSLEEAVHVVEALLYAEDDLALILVLQVHAKDVAVAHYHVALVAHHVDVRFTVIRIMQDELPFGAIKNI
jgi:hypothetical protein